jgi:enoyl-CoA hydratase/carnithine racemase
VSLDVAARGAVVTATLRRPDRRNALDHELWAALTAAFAAFERDPAARVLVVTGEGSAFCSGMDLTAFAERGPVHDPAVPSFLSMERTKPVIAAVNGPAVAAGFELVLACDLAVAAETATFALPEVRRGLVAGFGVWALARAIGPGPAVELALTGDPIDAARAHALGLVGAVVAPDRLAETAHALADRVAQGAPGAVAATLDLARRSFDLDAERLWALGLDAAGAALASADAQEGARAFAERRAPRWTGG